VLYAPILDIEEVMEDPQIRELETFYRVDHPTEGEVWGIHPPYLFNGKRVSAIVAPPTLGQHNAEILDELRVLRAIGWRSPSHLTGRVLNLTLSKTIYVSDAPYIRFVRAMVNVASILPVPDRQLAFGAFQMDSRRGTRSVLDPTTTSARLDQAISDVTALIPLTAELQLPNAKRLAEAYLRWCELLHPHKKAAAL